MNKVNFDRVQFLVLLALALFELGYAVDRFYSQVRYLPTNEQYGMSVMLLASYIFINTVTYYFLDYLQHQVFWWIKPDQIKFAN